MSAPRIALVTGATGAIGPTLVSQLLKNGWHVRTMSRHAAPATPATPGGDHFTGSITDRAVIARALEGVTVVFHLAALLHIENPPPDLEGEYRRINADGTRLLAEQAAATGVGRFVYFSTVKIYGTHQREAITESFTPQPKTMYARTKLEGEQAAHAVSGMGTVTLRLSPVYGPRVKGSWARLIHAIERGRFIPIGSLRNVHSLTHVEDVARAALLVAEHPSAAQEPFNLVAHDAPTLHEIFSAIYRVSGRKMPSLYIPAPIALAGAFTAEKLLSLMGKRSPLPVDSLRQLIHDEAYSGEKLRRLGFVPRVPLDQGWTNSVSDG